MLLVHEAQEVYGVKALAMQADVSSTEDAQRLDILVNNAGITRDRTFKKLSTEDWNHVIEVNLSSVFHMTHAALPYLQESQQGRIINISSIITDMLAYVKEEVREQIRSRIPQRRFGQPQEIASYFSLAYLRSN